MSDAPRFSYLVYHIEQEKYLGYKKLDERTIIGAGWFNSDIGLFFDREEWGARVIDIPMRQDNSYSHRVFLAEIANLVFSNDRDETFSRIICVPVNIDDVKKNHKIRDLDPDFTEAIPFSEAVGVGELIKFFIEVGAYRGQFMVIVQ